MKKIISIVILIFVGISLSAQTNTVSKNDSAKTDSVNEVMPEFPGGEAAFYKYLADSVKYPASAKLAAKEGTVYVQFTVEKDGSITDVKVVKEVSGAPELSAEAIRVISEMPKWSPGKLNGRIVRVSMTQPMKFVLGKK